jgi:hypothetical protein
VIDDDERPLSLQQRLAATTNQTIPTQAMKIILEEDESPESPSPE